VSAISDIHTHTHLHTQARHQFVLHHSARMHCFKSKTPNCFSKYTLTPVLSNGSNLLHKYIKCLIKPKSKYVHTHLAETQSTTSVSVNRASKRTACLPGKIHNRDRPWPCSTIYLQAFVLRIGHGRARQEQRHNSRLITGIGHGCARQEQKHNSSLITGIGHGRARQEQKHNSRFITGIGHGRARQEQKHNSRFITGIGHGCARQEQKHNSRFITGIGHGRARQEQKHNSRFITGISHGRARQEQKHN